MSGSDEDCEVSGHGSGNDALYSWRNWNDDDPDFPDFPTDTSFLSSSCIKSGEFCARKHLS